MTELSLVSIGANPRALLEGASVGLAKVLRKCIGCTNVNRMNDFARYVQAATGKRYPKKELAKALGTVRRSEQVSPEIQAAFARLKMNVGRYMRARGYHYED
jgi:hypothetical protein